MAKKSGDAPLDARAAEIRAIEDRFCLAPEYRAEFDPPHLVPDRSRNRESHVERMVGRSPWEYAHGIELLRAIDERHSFTFGQDIRTYSIHAYQVGKAEIDRSTLDSHTKNRAEANLWARHFPGIFRAQVVVASIDDSVDTTAKAWAVLTGIAETLHSVGRPEFNGNVDPAQYMDRAYRLFVKLQLDPERAPPFPRFTLTEACTELLRLARILERAEQGRSENPATESVVAKKKTQRLNVEVRGEIIATIDDPILIRLLGDIVGKGTDYYRFTPRAGGDADRKRYDRNTPEVVKELLARC